LFERLADGLLVLTLGAHTDQAGVQILKGAADATDQLVLPGAQDAIGGKHHVASARRRRQIM
jgi:hypothetical protein